MPSACPGKNSWPELVGVNGFKAAETIKSENAKLIVFIVTEEAPPPPDFECGRVLIVVNYSRGNIVVKIPTLG